jgi:hypothetical protein
MLYIQNKPCYSYAAKKLEEIRQSKLSKKCDDRLKKIWQKDLINETIDYKQTKLLTKNTKGKKNFLDASNINQLKFRSELIHKTLPTMDRMVEQKKATSDICFMCKTEIEDYDHIWECQYNRNQIPLTVEHLKELLGKELNKCEQTQKMVNYIENDNFIKSKMAKGIITDKETKILEDQNITNQKIVMEILDKWLIALYKTIWKPRNIETYKTQYIPNLQRRKTRIKTKHIINTITQKRKDRLKRIKRKKPQPKDPNKRRKINHSHTQNTKRKNTQDNPTPQKRSKTSKLIENP